MEWRFCKTFFQAIFMAEMTVEIRRLALIFAGRQMMRIISSAPALTMVGMTGIYRRVVVTGHQ